MYTFTLLSLRQSIIFLHSTKTNKISFMLHVNIFKYTVIYLNGQRGLSEADCIGTLVQLLSQPPEEAVSLLPAAMDTEELVD